MTKKEKTAEIIPNETRGKNCRPEEREEETVEVGQWYWLSLKDREDVEREYLSCVIHVGSNYVELDPVTKGDIRVHLDDFWKEARREIDPDSFIREKIGGCQLRTAHLMAKVQEVTSRLALTAAPGLGSGDEGQALARMDSSISAGEHKAALMKAKSETLPELFKEIEESNEKMAVWMTAQAIPMKAMAEGMKSSIEIIEGRIFNVELYAGLTEQIELIRDGEPGTVEERVRLMQRRHYMDEECLAQYEVGGMEYKDIREFDAWLTRRENLERLLPHRKCIVSMRIRRERKEHKNIPSLSHYVQILLNQDLDKKTFLYIRNGERVYRMSTDLDFGEKLFPDMDSSFRSTERRWAKTFGSRPSDDPLITEGAYLEMKKKDEENERSREEAYKKASKKDKWQHEAWRHRQEHTEYIPFDQSSVFYDDILRKETKAVEKHDRIALVLQGLLDRSEVLHPHPTWRIYTPEGFVQALELVYDDARALVAGERPDFEAFRTRLNKSIKAGTVTFGQHRAWAMHEAEKYRKRAENDYRRMNKVEYFPDEIEPLGNPGPGKFARVDSATSTGKYTYRWEKRMKRDWREREPFVPCSITVGSQRVLNVDAYEPGSFRQFFDDPRTRADYLRWAPFLLEAEEYKAGNRKVGNKG